MALTILHALDVLAAYPELDLYIKDFNGRHGFMYTVETDPQRRAYGNRLGELLDAAGMHSGSSWGCLLRGVQAVLTGALTRDQLAEQHAADTHRAQQLNAELDQRLLSRLAECPADSEEGRSLAAWQASRACALTD